MSVLVILRPVLSRDFLATRVGPRFLRASVAEALANVVIAASKALLWIAGVLVIALAHDVLSSFIG